MSNIICYCSGGLGNRLKPLSSCWAISQLTGRNLIIIWEPTLRCLAPFKSLFSNQMAQLSESFLPALTNVKVYCPAGAADYECKLNSIYGLRDLVRRVGSTPLDTKSILEDKTETILIFSNTELQGLSSNVNFFSTFLEVNTDILNKVNSFWDKSGLTKDYIGVHARGTDFEDAGISADYYLNSMGVLSNWDFFVCSDSPEYEKYIQKKDGRNVVIRSDKKYVSKQGVGAWSNNVYTPTDTVQDSLVDLLLLARTNFTIYHENSSFAHLVKYFKIS